MRNASKWHRNRKCTWGKEEKAILSTDFRHKILKNEKKKKRDAIFITANWIKTRNFKALLIELLSYRAITKTMDGFERHLCFEKYLNNKQNYTRWELYYSRMNKGTVKSWTNKIKNNSYLKKWYPGLFVGRGVLKGIIK